MKIKMLVAVAGAMFSVACGGGSLTGPAVELTTPGAAANDALVAASDFPADATELLPVGCEKGLTTVRIAVLALTRSHAEARATYLSEDGQPIKGCKPPTWSAKGTKLEPTLDPFAVRFVLGRAADIALFALAPNGVQGRLDVKF